MVISFYFPQSSPASVQADDRTRILAFHPRLRRPGWGRHCIALHPFHRCRGTLLPSQARQRHRHRRIRRRIRRGRLPTDAPVAHPTHRFRLDHACPRIHPPLPLHPRQRPHPRQHRPGPEGQQSAPGLRDPETASLRRHRRGLLPDRVGPVRAPDVHHQLRARRGLPRRPRLPDPPHPGRGFRLRPLAPRSRGRRHRQV